MKLTNYQLYCILLILVAPLAYLELPHSLIHVLYANSWLAVMAAIIPGFLIIFMFSCIIKKSTRPFPLMLDEHLGKAAGRLIGLWYIPVFMIESAYSLRLFIEFMKMNVLPATPISVFIGVLLFLCLMAIKTGLENIARVLELIIPVGSIFALSMVIIAVANNFHLNRLEPIAYMSGKAFGWGTLTATFVLGKMMPVLSLGFFIKKKEHTYTIMKIILYTYVPLITLTTLGVVMTLGTIPSLSLSFPVFSMIRLARIGTFVQNLDIFFVAIWITGIFGTVTIPFFMACFTTQQVFGLRDYRFVAAPSSIIIGVISILISPNNLGVVVWGQKIIPLIYTLFFIVIPFSIFIIVLFKPHPADNLSDNANSPPTPLHNAIVSE